MKADSENKYYLFVLDYEDRKVYRYSHEDILFGGSHEEFLAQAGHTISQVEYMLTNNKYLENGN
jgi:hypothetical protein|tara:strand:- start:1206 stop:1397 length:192 start_codon:yes stop_codon:yes gene_type:complete